MTSAGPFCGALLLKILVGLFASQFTVPRASVDCQLGIATWEDYLVKETFESKMPRRAAAAAMLGSQHAKL